MAAVSVTFRLMEMRGELWTAEEARDALGLAVDTIYVWVTRGHLTPAPIPGRPKLYWSDDVYDCHLQRQENVARDTSGKFCKPDYTTVR